MKKILIAVFVLAILVAAGVYIFLTNIDAIARKVIEKTGTQVLGTPVTVGAVAISPSTGKAVLRDLKVANPSGFSPEPAIYFSELSAQVDLRTRVVRRVIAREPVFRVEIRGDRSNFDQLARHLWTRLSDRSDSEARSGGKAVAAGTGDAGGDKESSPVFDIRVFDIQNARLVIFDQQGRHDELTLSRLVLRNLHGTSRQIATHIASQIMARIAVYRTRKAIENRIRDTVEKHGGKGLGELLKASGVN